MYNEIETIWACKEDRTLGILGHERWDPHS